MYKKEVFMKKACMLLIWCFVGIFSANAQKFALIDMEYILENIPEYQKANERGEAKVQITFLCLNQ